MRSTFCFLGLKKYRQVALEKVITQMTKIPEARMTHADTTQAVVSPLSMMSSKINVLRHGSVAPLFKYKFGLKLFWLKSFEMHVNKQVYFD